MQQKYKRVLLKLSGEVLAGKLEFGLDYDAIDDICEQIVEVAQEGIQISMVVGGGNIIRGSQTVRVERAQADYMGMLGTVINALALQDALERLGQPTRVQSAIEMRQIAETVIRRRAIRHLEKGRVVIFGCGTGNPFFSTDTAAALRAAEIEADILLLAKNVDGVYSADPQKHPDAVKYETLTHLDVVKEGLGVMDGTAATLCMENKIPILVFGLEDTKNIIRAVMGEKIGTIVKEEMLP